MTPLDVPTLGDKVVIAVYKFVVLLVCLLFLAILVRIASARNLNGQYDNQPQSVRDWYESQTTTPETRKRIKRDWYVSCCLHSDTVKAKFAVNRVNGQDIWMYQQEGTTEWKVVPPDTVQGDIDTPTHQPVLFVDATGNNLGPVCFFPGVARG